MGTTAKLFLTDYASYNEGNQLEHGHWIELSDFSDADEFMGYVTQHFEDVGIEDPEPMFTDFEGFPDDLYSESMSEGDIQAIYDHLEVMEKFDDLSDDEWVSLHNEYCSENRPDDTIHSFDEEFFDTYFEGRPMDAARAAAFGSLNQSDDYITFDGYGNLESFNNPLNHIDKDEIIEDYKNNPRNYSL